MFQNDCLGKDCHIVASAQEIKDGVDLVGLHCNLEVEVSFSDDAVECASRLKSYARKHQVVFLQIGQSYEFFSCKRMILTYDDAELVVEKDMGLDIVIFLRRTE